VTLFFISIFLLLISLSIFSFFVFVLLLFTFYFYLFYFSLSFFLLAPLRDGLSAPFPSCMLDQSGGGILQFMDNDVIIG